MTPEQFREYGHRMVDWVADYWATLEQRPVQPSVAPGEVAAALPPVAARARGEPFDAHAGRPGRGSSPRPPPTGSTRGSSATSRPTPPGPACSATWSAAGLGTQGMLWSTGPGRDRGGDGHAGLAGAAARACPSGSARPAPGGGVIQDSASSADPGRHPRRAAPRQRRALARSPVSTGRYTVYTSTGGPFVDREGGADRRARRRTTCGSSTSTTTSPCALTPWPPRSPPTAPPAPSRPWSSPRSGRPAPPRSTRLPPIGPICRERVWLHVDAAYAGAAAVCPELRHTHAGLEYADSYCFDPHKWLLTGFDCDAFWVADRAELIEALTVLPEYLRNAATASGAVIDYRDWQVPLGRRFRALKLWFVLRWYGVEGLRAHIRRCVALAAPVRRLGPRRRPVRGGRAAPVLAGLLPAARRRTRPTRSCCARSTPPARRSSPTPGSAAATRCGWRSARR